VPSNVNLDGTTVQLTLNASIISPNLSNDSPRESILSFEFRTRRRRNSCDSVAVPSEGPMNKSSDPWSIVVIVLTVALFILALFVKGFTKGLLVECGVLMVSIKLILMAKKTVEIEQNLERRLDRIENLLERKTEAKSPAES
jgi:hypothetical protein